MARPTPFPKPCPKGPVVTSIPVRSTRKALQSLKITAQSTFHQYGPLQGDPAFLNQVDETPLGRPSIAGNLVGEASHIARRNC
jgi:hypothetical protein